MKQYLLLPVLLTMLQRDIDAIRQATPQINLSHIVVVVAERMMDFIRQDLARIRQSLGLAGIRIYSEDKNSTGITSKYVCRGYHETIALSRSDVKTEVNLLVGHYSDSRLSRSHG
ncbi:MAG: hypothetical protein H7X86_04150 [Gorillibacterium sp.]|nr:hypothetical protein [Gorillibacterium sp.]